jgi:hypothetical protein
MHAVTLRCDMLPQSAIPRYEINGSVGPIWYLTADGDPEQCERGRRNRFTGYEYQIEAPTAIELRAQFETKLRELVLTAGHGGMLIIGIRTDSVISVPKPIHILQFASIFVCAVDVPPLVVRSMALDYTTPEYLYLGIFEERMQQMAFIMQVMES